ncbi:MAG: leucine-rich repeat domain-containing protein [Sulfurimonas sp.]|nr:leucine-rich repeat domain-containing protein [Sulfurimonas sp.]
MKYYNNNEKIFSILEMFYSLDCVMKNNNINSLEYKIWSKKNYKFLTVTELCNLTKLELNYLGLRQIPQEIGLLQNLQELDLSGNILTSLPKEIYNLKNLKVLDLGSNIYGGNNISSLSKSICKLTSLEGLSLINTEITELPIEILALENLSYIRVSDKALYHSDVVKSLAKRGCHIDFNEIPQFI